MNARLVARLSLSVEVFGSVQRYIFDGMHEAGWSEWEIAAEGFTLIWEAVLGDAWYAGLNDPGAGEARQRNGGSRRRSAPSGARGV